MFAQNRRSIFRITSMRIRLLLPGLAIAGLGLLALPDRIAADGHSDASTMQAYGLDLVRYATVERTDGSYRRMLIDRMSLEALARDGVLPDGTRILMETYRSPGRVGTVFHKQKTDGRWLYGSFSGRSAEANLDVRPQASCLSCHTRAADTDFTYTLPSLNAVAAGAAETVFACDRGGRAPCDLAIYRNGAAQ